MGYLVSVSLGGYLLGKGAEQLLGRFQARIVGALVLGSAVTIPEYLFAIVSVLDQKNAQALGSAYGGNIFLFTVAYGASFSRVFPTRFLYPRLQRNAIRPCYTVRVHDAFRFELF